MSMFRDSDAYNIASCTFSSVEHSGLQKRYWIRIIIGSDRRPETKQGIEGKIVRFRSGTVRVRDKDRRSEAISFGTC